MEVIIALILLYLAIQLLIWLCTNVIGPLMKVIMVIAAVVGVAVGAWAALSSYFKAVKAFINPYQNYVDKSSHPQKARRNYFFGPGLLQLKNITFKAWKGMFDWLATVTGAAIAMVTWTDSWVIRALLIGPAVVFALTSYVAIGFVGGSITLALCALHMGIMLVVMAIIYTIFTITWIVDRLYLWNKSIRSVCSYCQERYVIPVFECPNCGELHDKLVPGPYGIWHRKCTCGEVLPSTFLNGRSNLKATCPLCGNKMVASDAQQISISLVGGSSSGKTVLLSAFYHTLFDSIRRAGNQVSLEIPPEFKNLFEDMELWYQGEVCNATAVSDTATMYSVLLDSAKMDVRKQFSVYDIAGEAFLDPAISAMIPQKQFKYADGIVILVDPLGADMMRDEAVQSGDDITNYSDSEAAVIITNFVTYLKNNLTSSHISNMIQKPVSVVITKADLVSVKRRISYNHIRSKVKQGLYSDFDTARDELCKQFLVDIGLGSAVDAISADFTNVHYYPVSAIGHEPDGEAYDPEHVMEPFSQIIAQKDRDLAEQLGIVDSCAV